MLKTILTDFSRKEKATTRYTRIYIKLSGRDNTKQAKVAITAVIIIIIILLLLIIIIIIIIIMIIIIMVMSVKIKSFDSRNAF